MNVLKRQLEIKRRKEELRSLLDSKTATTEQINDAIKEVDELDAEAKQLEERAKQPNEIEKRGKTILTMNEQKEELGLDSAEYRSAFFKHLAGVSLSEVEQRAMTTNASSAGVAVPTSTMNKIYEKISNASIVYGKVTVSHLKGNVVIPYEKVTNDVERKAEGAEGTILNDTIDALRLGAKKYIKLVQLTCELENTSIDALEGYVVAQLSKKLAQAIDYDIINGSGTNCAKGILPSLTVSETTGTEWAYDDVCDLFADIKAAARKSATLMMSTNTLYKQIKKIKDNEKRPIFDPNTNKVLGRDVDECDDVPDGMIIFGDFAAYQFNWSKEATIDKSGEVAFKSGDSVFRILALADGGLLELGAFAAKKVKEAAAG